MIDNNVEDIKKHIEAIMEILGLEKTESNENTPLRIAKMYCNEVFSNRNNRNLEDLNDKMKVFSNNYESGLVVMKDIEFSSMCEHHWMPFFGKVSVGYVPDRTVIGLSKIPRVVKYFSKRPQLQEQLTSDIGDYLFGILFPKALFVEITAEHTCVRSRGAESNCITETSYKKFSSAFIGEATLTNQWYEEFKRRM